MQTVIKPLILTFLFAISVIPQNSNGTLYSRGLQACLEKEIEAYAKFSSRDLQNVIVVYDFDLTRDLPTKLGGITVRYLSEQELVEEYKKLGKEERERGVPFIKIFPISDKDEKLFFAYNNYWFRYSEKGGFLSKKKLISSMSLEGGCHAEIGFDSIEGKLFIKRVELWGV